MKDRLQYVCDLANDYKVSPATLMNKFKIAQEKSYIKNDADAYLLLDRWCSIYKERKLNNLDMWHVDEIYIFNRKPTKMSKAKED